MAVLLHIVRALGVLIAALGAALVVCWTWFPGVLDRYHSESLRAYRGQYEAARGNLRTLTLESSKGSPDEAMAKAQALVQEVEHYRNEDALFPKRRLIVRDAARLAIRSGNLDKAIEWIDGHLALDPLDIPLALEAAAALEDEAPASARARRAELFARWPSLPMVAQPFLEQLAREGANGELEEATHRFLSYVHQPSEAMQGVMNAWRLFWSETPKFTSEESYLWETKLKGTRFELQAGLPAGQTHVRLQVPRFSSLELRDASLSLHPKGDMIPVPFESLDDLSGIDVHALGWSMEPGGEAGLSFRVPDALEGRGCVVLLAGEVTAVPKWLRELLARGVGQGLARRYQVDGDERRLALVRSAWGDYHLLHPIQCIEATSSTVSYRSKGDALAFDIVLQIPKAGSLGSAHLGLYPGDTLVLESSALEAPGLRVFIEDVEFEEGVGRVTGADARIEWRADEAFRGPAPKSHTLRGHVR